MSKVSVTADFEVSVDELWNLLGDFGDMNKWAGTDAGICTSEGEGVGALRTIVLPDGGEIVDRLEEETDLSYTYSIVTSPLPFSFYRATMTVSSLSDNTSRLVWSCDFEAKGLSESDATAFIENMYARGVARMRQALDESAA